MSISGGKREPPVVSAKTVAVMSDLHLGASNCVLGEAGQLDRLSALLDRHAVKVDVLVLNGDMCDFALATMQETIGAARRFLQKMARYCDTMVYVPGNHDHHSWLLANEVHEFLFTLPQVDPACVERTERMYQSTFLKTLFADANRDIWIAYPNLYWKPPELPGATYIFHHGHFCEELYSIVSDTLTAAFPDAQQDGLEFVESVNFGWLEFIWYQLGQAGKGIGAHGLIEKLYAQIREDGPAVLAGGIQRLYEARIRPLVHRALKEEADEAWWLTEGAAESVAGWIDRHAPGLVIAFLSAYAKHKEETKQPSASDWRFRPLDADLANHCFAYLKRSRSSTFVGPQDRLALFFGHTHVAGAWLDDPAQQLFNDGGWIRGSHGEWPDAHILAIDAAGRVTDLAFAETDSACTATSLT